jgi:lipopolysaccharide transport system ATP-binding protein
MQAPDSAIKVSSLSKIYRLYASPHDRLKEALHPLRKKFHRDFYALRNVCFDIEKGETVGIIGQNGSGKSTLLSTIAGVLTPSSGTIEIFGKVSSLLELGTGFNPELTGIQNIYFNGAIQGFQRKEIDSKLDEIISFAEIGEFIHQPVKVYSSGMYVRLAFAMVVCIEPEILIIDEALAVGDELFRRKCYAKMEEFIKGNKTILFVSHDIQSVNQLCTRALFLNQGELLLDGPTKMVTAQYERYLFTKPEMKQAVKEEIILINHDKILKEATYKEIENKNEHSILNEQSADESEKVDQAAITYAVDLAKSKAYFVPDLVSKTRVEYRNFDVDIHDVHIATPDGEIVNVLLSGEKYFYRYSVTFNMDAEDVAFGMMIKTEKGMDICGANSAEPDILLKKVLKGNRYKVSWAFQCNLLHGNYFINAGVSSHSDKNFRFLNRIVDAIMFKVQRNDKNIFGIIYMVDPPGIVLEDNETSGV